jgi:hypothetical protein
MIRLYLTLRTCTRPIVLDTRRRRGSGHGSTSFYLHFKALQLMILVPKDMPCNTVNRLPSNLPSISVFVVLVPSTASLPFVTIQVLS